MTEPRPVILGKRYRDTISGFEGVATGRYEYLYGCVRYELEAALNKDGEIKIVTNIFDEQRLVAADETPVEGSATSGGPHQAPPRTGHT